MPRPGDDAGKELRETADRLRGLLDTALDCIVMIDRDGRVLEFNPAAERVFGHRAAEIRGQPITLIVPPRHREAHERGMARYLATGEASVLDRRVEIEALRADGTEFPVELAIGAARVGGKTVFVARLRDIGERRRADTALRRSEEHSARAQRAAAIGTWEWDVATGALTWSGETYRLFGVAPEAFTPTLDNFHSLVHVGDRERVGRIGRLIRDGRVPSPADVAIDHRVVTPDGRMRILHREGAAVLGPNGAVVSVAGTIQDVTEKRRAEERLRESEERYRLAARATSDAIYVLDVASGAVEWNENLRRYGHEVNQTQLNHGWWLARVHPEDAGRVEGSFAAALAGEAEVWSTEYRFRRADGTWATVFDRAYIQRRVDGSAWRVVGAMMDISERRRIEQQLGRSAAHLSRAQRMAGMGSWEFDAETGTYRGSEEAYRIMGLPPAANIEAAAVMAQIHPDDRAVFTAALERTLAGGRDLVEGRILRPDGTQRVARSQTEPLRDESGRIVGVLGTVQDITEQRRLEEERRALEQQLLQAQKLDALGTLAGGIAHDLNNTLVPIMGLTRMLADAAPPESADRADLDLVFEAACRGRDLVRQVLAFGRQDKPRTEPVDMRALVERNLPVLRAGVPSTIRFEVSLGPVPTIEADPSQLFQVLVNIVTNAAQAIGAAHGTIAVELAADSRAVRLRVSDTGCGMDEQTASRVFDPFFTTKGPGEGTGLGLPVVHGIVTSHGGQVRLDTAPGEGSTVTVELPLDRCTGG